MASIPPRTGTKVTLGKNAPIKTEGAGIVAGDSLAAESDTFAERNPESVVQKTSNEEPDINREDDHVPESPSGLTKYPCHSSGTAPTFSGAGRYAAAHDEEHGAEQKESDQTIEPPAATSGLTKYPAHSVGPTPTFSGGGQYAAPHGEDNNDDKQEYDQMDEIPASTRQQSDAPWTSPSFTGAGKYASARESEQNVEKEDVKEQEQKPEQPSAEQRKVGQRKTEDERRDEGIAMGDSDNENEIKGEKNASFTEFGTENDPGRLAELKFTTGVSVDMAVRDKQTTQSVEDGSTFEVLDAETPA